VGQRSRIEEVAAWGAIAQLILAAASFTAACNSSSTGSHELAPKGGSHGSAIGGAGSAAAGASAISGAPTVGGADVDADERCRQLRARVNKLLGDARLCTPGSACVEVPNALCGCAASVADADAPATQNLLSAIRELEATAGCTWPQCPTGPVPPNECGQLTKECRVIEMDAQGQCQ
jgi:hypothetical protein